MATRAMTTGIPFLSGGFASGCSGTVAGGFSFGSGMLPAFHGAMEIDLLLADGEITVVQFLWNRVKAIAEIKVDQ